MITYSNTDIQKHRDTLQKNGVSLKQLDSSRSVLDKFPPNHKEHVCHIWLQRFLGIKTN